MAVSVVIGVSCNELARYAIFYVSLLHLRFPVQVDVFQARGANIAENRNLITERALSRGAEWILYVDDDQVFAPNTLTNLLAHNLDVVSGMYVSREMPFIPHMYDIEDERGFVRPRLIEPFESGLKLVNAVGAGCLLVSTKVIHSLEPPYWRLGQITKDGWNDDIDFCRRVRHAGFQIWCDTDTLVGHQTNGTLWPFRQPDGEWTTIMVQGSETIATWPAARRSPLVGVDG